MKFTKMQGLGNDYVYINCFEEKVENPSELSVRISDRHFGIGSDGLVLIRPCDSAMYDNYIVRPRQFQSVKNEKRKTLPQTAKNR